MRFKLTVDGTELTGTLDEGPAARDFATLLPLTVELADFNGRERVADLPRPLDLDGEPAGTSAGPGDIADYAPWETWRCSTATSRTLLDSSGSDASTILPHVSSQSCGRQQPPS